MAWVAVDKDGAEHIFNDISRKEDIVCFFQ